VGSGGPSSHCRIKERASTECRGPEAKRVAIRSNGLRLAAAAFSSLPASVAGWLAAG
jgi:hypothetical protein